MNERHQRSDKTLAIIIPSLLFLTILVIAGGGKLLKVNWGIDQVGLFPTYIQIIWFALLLLSLAATVSGWSGPGLMEYLNRLLWGEKNAKIRWGLLGILTLLFIVFRFEAHLYGDAYIRISNLSQKAIPIFRWYEYGGTVLPYLFYLPLKGLGIKPEPVAAWGFQIVSFLSGMAFLITGRLVAKKVSSDYNARSFFFCLTVFSGLTLYGFGLVEVYSPLVPLAAWFILQAFRYYESPSARNLILLFLIVAIGLCIHLLFAAMLPSAIFAAFGHMVNRSKKESITALLTSLAVLCGAVATIYILAEQDIAVGRHFLPLTEKPPFVDYSIFSLNHLVDILNLATLFAPLFILFLFFSAFRLIKKERHPTDTFLAILRLSQVALIFILVPLNGMAREIPLFGFLLTGAIFFGAYSLTVNESPPVAKLRQLPFLAFAFLLVLPTFVVHLTPSVTVRHLDRFLAYNEAHYEKALLAMRDYYFTVGNFSEADRREQMIPGKSKTALESKLVQDLFVNERVNDAYAYAVRLVEGNPYVAHYRMQLGNLLKYFKRYPEAERELKLSIVLEPFNADYYYFLAQLYNEMNLRQKAFEILQKAYSFAPDNVMILSGLAAHHFRLGELERAEFYANEGIRINPDEPYPYMFKGMVEEKQGRLQQALESYGRFIKLNENLPEIPDIRRRMNSIVLKMRETAPSE
ncbi:MAG: glycosyltransferase family 39 protein [bacterium]|jgi:Flp pilus assembly protein TadD/lipid-A-disaccharide synthase-like uncharacterized protein